MAHAPTTAVPGCTRGRNAWGGELPCCSASARRWLRNGARMRRNGSRPCAGLRHARRRHRALGRLQTADEVVEPYKNRGQRRQNGFCCINRLAHSQQRRAGRTYPDNPIILDHVLARYPIATAVQTLIRAGTVHTHLFHRICELARPMETPLCRMCFLFLHAPRPLWAKASRLYIQNEGLSENFRERG